MRLVFIAGWMRSGTTLLGELVGSCPGTLALGEVTQLWAALDRAKPCTCGQAVPDCPVWGPVAKELQSQHGIGPDGDTSYADFDALVRRVLRFGGLPGLSRLRAEHPEQFPPEVRRYVEAMSTVLQVVSAVTGNPVLVDSSKQPAALLCAGLVPDLDVTPLHLVRDPRAVAYSESRRGEWAGVQEHLTPPGRRVLKSAAAWSVTAVLCHLVGTRFAGYRLLRYERLAAAPRETMTTVAAGLGLAPAPFAGADTAQLAPSHIVDGNPSRFGDRLRQIRSDERWRRKMPRTERLAVLAVTFPVRMAVRVVTR